MFSGSALFNGPAPVQQQDQGAGTNGLYPPSLYQDGTWSTNQFNTPASNPNFFGVTAQNGRVIERPFQMPNGPYAQFPPATHGGSVMAQPQQTMNGGATPNSNIIDAPFAWRSPAFYQQPQQQQQPRFINNAQNPFIP